MEIGPSDIVISLCGRDKGRTFFVVGQEGEYAFICDGRLRRVEKPKKKKLKHLRFQARSDCRTATKIRNGEKITNSEVRKALAEYTANNGEEGGMLNGKRRYD